MDLRSILSPEDVLTEFTAAEKTELLRELSGRAALTVAVDPQLVLSEILRHEELGSSGVGNGVAMPHARFRSLVSPYGVLARLKQPVEFAAIDGIPVDIVFLLLLPELPAVGQLQALACVARQLRNPEILLSFRKAPDAVQAYRAVIGPVEESPSCDAEIRNRTIGR
ncbi:PTS sugar transporter subunit IIA [Bradyrhizobium sp. 2]|nr:PTS sugar transporter subunit IIA [Bradyrhizobium sp. 2]MCK1462964.1 PTS sugar transporter subunit IIA [Bradyrhizobium sp. 2]